jgi:hypothetical protein
MCGSIPVACISLEVEHTGGRTDKHGQFMLDSNESRPNAGDLFAEAQSAEQAGNTTEAEHLYSNGQFSGIQSRKHAPGLRLLPKLKRCIEPPRRRADICGSLVF